MLNAERKATKEAPKDYVYGTVGAVMLFAFPIQALVAIWTGDARWFWTGFVLVFVGAFFVFLSIARDKMLAERHALDSRKEGETM